MKYLIVRSLPGGAEHAILFSSQLRHAEVAGMLRPPLEVTSAGFWSAVEQAVTPERSTSVGHAPRGQRDERIIDADMARRDD